MSARDFDTLTAIVDLDGEDVLVEYEIEPGEADAPDCPGTPQGAEILAVCRDGIWHDPGTFPAQATQRAEAVLLQRWRADNERARIDAELAMEDTHEPRCIS